MAAGGRSAMVPYWDLFVRLFHWSLAAIVVVDHFVFDDGGELHEWLGYAACALVGARVLWGFFAPAVSARWKSWRTEWPSARDFPAHVRRYLAAREPRTLGHPPLAQLAMIPMLLLVLLLGLTGWMMSWDRYFGEEWLEELHGALSWALIALTGVHVVGVLRASWIHRENLVASMIHGRKRRL